MLDEAQIEALRATYGKVGVRDYNGHQLVFRKPTRDDCREYRRMMNSPNEKGDAIESLAQKMIVALDGETSVIAARTRYTGVFLEEYPLFSNNQQTIALISALSGVVEEEDAEDLGKGASFRSGRQKSSRADSLNGSGTAPEPPTASRTTAS